MGGILTTIKNAGQRPQNVSLDNFKERIPYLNAVAYNLYDFTYIKNYFLNLHNELPFQHDICYCFEVDDFIKLMEENGFTFLLRKETSQTVDNKNEHHKLAHLILVNDDSSVLVYVDCERFDKRKIISFVSFIHKRDVDVKWIVDEVLKLPRINKNANKSIHIITMDGSHLSLMQHRIEFNNVDVAKTYNDDFKPVNELIINSLDSSKKGIILLHGEPGCGKTSYIRHITSIVNNRKIIFFPPNMSNELSSPSFINLLIENKNSILIIEDAENVIKSRKNGSSQAISNLLNVSDGLLSDILNITIIATFNCQLNDIDEALMRKGRMICRYEFKKLEKRKAQALSDSIGFKREITEDMSLANIYNQDGESYVEEKKIIGFKL